MKHGALFSGSGGFEQAGLLFGIEPVWASEIEPFPIRVTRQRFPQLLHLGDINRIDGAKIEKVDVISGGSPCQDMSIAGRREGLDGGNRYAVLCCNRKWNRASMRGLRHGRNRAGASERSIAMDCGMMDVTNRYMHALILLSEYCRRAADPDDSFKLDEVQRRIEGGDAMLLWDIKIFTKLANDIRKGYVKIEDPGY